MALIWGRFALIWPLLVVVAMAGCERESPDQARDSQGKDVASTRGSESSGLTSAQMRIALNDTVRALGCEDLVRYHDDLYFWDSAVGAECIQKAGETTTIMVYQHLDSPVAALAHGGALVSTDNPALVSNHLLVLGDRAALDKVRAASSELREESEIVTSSLEVPNVSPHHEAVALCSGFVASNLANFAAGRPEQQSDIEALDNTYPGYKTLVTSLHSTPEMKRLAAQRSPDPLVIESTMSAFGQKIKCTCAESTLRTDNEPRGG